MNIIISGCGNVGYHLARTLMKEGHSVTVIDADAEVCQRVSRQLDVLCLQGSGMDLDVLNEAGAASAYLFIAVTRDEKANILSALMARHLGCRIALIRLQESTGLKSLSLLSQDLKLSLSLNPDELAARDIVRILEFPASVNVDSFSAGRIELMEFEIDDDSPLIGKNLIEVRQAYPGRYLFSLCVRRGVASIPRGNFIIQAQDHLTLSASRSQALGFFSRLKLQTTKIRRIMILGGGDLGLSVCQQLAGQSLQITLVEKDPARCALISQWFPDMDVCQGDITNHPFLQTLGFDAMDALIAVTGSDEVNAMLALYAKARKIRLVFCRQNTHSYLPILHQAKVRTVLPKDLATEQILGYVRSIDSRDDNPIVTLHALADNQIEALEFEIGPDAKRIIAARLMDLPLKKNILITAILRSAQILIPTGQDQLQTGDFIIVLAPSGQVRRLADLLEDSPRLL
ncbi:Trk system potassium transporter TrkA [Holdemania massiliensis]|uniref:Trk system potassium transporter TrkA n=1 Tax=Holdemania massiliensis TaxID=1468449 RepID=UPI001F0617AD|nr:Trk system potassium transporter TrkA [Holdemania massiliensis]MCH1942245.1 Trk system potassium transporter TrkA [Holdemania massiliensis]